MFIEIGSRSLSGPLQLEGNQKKRLIISSLINWNVLNIKNRVKYMTFNSLSLLLWKKSVLGYRETEVKSSYITFPTLS
jgi:hypothetical protein